MNTQIEHTNSKGTTYYLHVTTGRNGKTSLYYFAKASNAEKAVYEMPVGRIIKENPRTNLPILAKA